MQVSGATTQEKMKKNALYSIYLNNFQRFFPLKQADEQNRALSEKARLHLEKYNFPVEMMVALPNGTIVNIWLFHHPYNFWTIPKSPQVMCRSTPVDILVLTRINLASTRPKLDSVTITF